MTDQDITELLAHPRVQRMLRRMAQQEARKAILEKEEPKAPRGHVSINKAAELLGYTNATIRTYKCTGQLAGKHGYVTIESMDALKRKRK